VTHVGHGWLAAVSRLVAFVTVVVVVGLLPWLSGQDPAAAILRAKSADQEATPEALQAIRDQLGLDDGPLVLLGRWFSGLLHGDAGVSWISGRPVFPGMVSATGVSVTLMLFALLVAAVVAIALCLPTLARGLDGRDARTSGAWAALFTALPEFLLAAVALVVGAVWLGWFPPYGWDGPASAVLPALSLGVPAGGLLGRLFADGLAATFTEAWVGTWQMAGFSRRQVAVAAFRRTLPGLTSQLGLTLVGLTGGAVAVEKVFAIPGLGGATLGAAAARDIPALQLGIMLLLVIALALGVLAGLLRRLMLGPALHAGVMPTKANDPSSPSSRAYLVPAITGSALLLLIVTGLPRDPYASQHLRLAAPSWAAPLGADASGRDLLARVAHGAANTILVALAVVALCLLLGLVVGLLPRLAAGPIELTNATPPIIAGLLVAAVSGTSTAGAAVAVTLVSWAPLAAHTAALIEEVRAQPHVRIAPVLGVGRVRLTMRYLLPATVGPVFRHAMLRLPGIALALAALGFLGLGPRPPRPEWGLVLGEGMPYVERAPWAVAVPAAALIALSVLAVSAANLRPSRRRRAPLLRWGRLLGG
jgi:peptide/nickel transport system permease protein